MVARQRLRGVHFGNRNSKRDGVIAAGFNHDAHLARWLLPRFTGAINVPATAHEHVRNKDGASGEIDEEPFAARLDAIDLLAYEGRVLVKARQQCVVRAKPGNGTPGEGATQCAGCTKDGIAFGHSIIGGPETETRRDE